VENATCRRRGAANRNFLSGVMYTFCHDDLSECRSNSKKTGEITL
jgi:hypothetical protein